MARTTRRGPWWQYDGWRELRWVLPPTGKRAEFRLRDGARALGLVGWRFKRRLATDGVSLREGCSCTDCRAKPHWRARARRAADRGAIREGLYDHTEALPGAPGICGQGVVS